MILSRWGTWWLALCAVVAVGVAVIGGVADQNGTIVAITAAAGFVGQFLLNRLQYVADTRPCPRCGERVTVGQLECDSCGFDFNAR